MSEDANGLRDAGQMQRGRLRQPTAPSKIANTNAWSTKQLVTMALMCAIGVLLSFVEIPLVPGAAWLKYDASIVPAMVCGFAYGPASGIAVGVMGAILHGLLTADLAGAVMNCLVAFAYVLASALVYRRLRSFKGAVAGLAIGAACAVAMAVVGNLVVTPLWLGVPVDSVVAMVLPALIPFNAIKALLNSAMTLVVYRAISRLIEPSRPNKPNKGVQGC